MPWNTDDEFTIVEYLGLPFNPDSVRLVRQRMDNIEYEKFIAIIQGYLAEIASIEEKIVVKRDNADVALTPLKTEVRKFAQRLALALGLEVRNDVF